MVDGSISLLRQARETTKGQATYIASDTGRLPFHDSSFDAILMIRVLHHIENSRACLKELHRVLGSDGRFVFSYMNKRNTLRIVRWLIRMDSANPFTLDTDASCSTFISHHPTAVRGLLEEVGFSDVRDYGAGVMDRIAGRIGVASRWSAPGKTLAPFLGQSKLAPWIFSRATARGNPPVVAADGLVELLQCPSCDGALTAEQAHYRCCICHRRYPIESGIIDLRV